MISAVCLTAMGCVSQSQSGTGVATGAPTTNKASALLASGFKVVPADTAQRQAALRQLPPQKFVRQLKGDKVVFVYADPANCNCLYAGGLTAYTNYRGRALDRQLAEEEATSQENNWDWSPWTFGYPYGWPDD